MRGQRVTGWRRIANAMWRAPDDPQIFGALDVDAGALVAYLAQARAAGHRVTPTHLVGRAIAHMLAEVPDLNTQIRRGRARPRPSIDIFFIAAISGGHDLSGIKVREADRKSAVEIAVELERRVASLRGGNDRDFQATKRLTDAAPPWILRQLLRATAFLTQDLRVEIPLLSLRPTPFGSAMVTNVGTFGLPQGFAPLAWMYDVPLLVLVGELTERAVAVAGEVVVRPVLPITATIDHRYVDGWHIAQAARALQEYLADPAAFEPRAAEGVRPVQHA